MIASRGPTMVPTEHPVISRQVEKVADLTVANRRDRVRARPAAPKSRLLGHH